MAQHKRNIFDEQSGFSLSELMVVLVIIGILVMLAIPIYRNITTKAKTTEAKIMLGQVETLQKSYYLEHDYYADELGEIGFEQNKLIDDGGKARYVIEIEEADETGFVAIATSIVDFDKDGTFNIWQVNEEGIIEQRVAD